MQGEQIEVDVGADDGQRFRLRDGVHVVKDAHALRGGPGALEDACSAAATNSHGCPVSQQAGGVQTPVQGGSGSGVRGP